MIDKFKKDLLSVRLYDTRMAMGNDAAHHAAKKIRLLLENRDFISIIFAAAPSQNEFLSALCAQPNIEWNRITAFHMDEYVNLPADAPQGFGNFLRINIFDKVPFRMVHYLNGNAPDLNQECKRYSELLATFKPDMVCMGIGENAHIAFNDPHVADLNDPVMVKVVDLDMQCRRSGSNACTNTYCTDIASTESCILHGSRHQQSSGDLPYSCRTNLCKISVYNLERTSKCHLIFG